MKKPQHELNRYVSPRCCPRILTYAGWVIGFCALMALAYGTALLMLETFIK